MTAIFRGIQPGIQIVIPAATAKKRLVQVITADASGASNTMFAVDLAAKGVPAVAGPTTNGPLAIIVPDSVGDHTAKYFETSPEIVAPSQDIENNIVDALRKAEDWGWSNVLANVKRIVVGYPLWARLLPIRKHPAFAPQAEITSSGEPGLIFVREDIAKDTSEGGYPVEDLAWLLIHEAMHHAFYSVGYAMRFSSTDPDFIISELTYEIGNFLLATEHVHHLGTSIASVVNATTLGMDAYVDNYWPYTENDVYPIGNKLPSPPWSPLASPDLRSKSVIYPVPDEFGQHLDVMATYGATWGLGGWIDWLGPPLNYTTSGVIPQPDHLVLDLAQSDDFLAWQIVGRTMVRTVDRWAGIPGKLDNNPNIKGTATGMGMIALMAKLGLIPKK